MQVQAPRAEARQPDFDAIDQELVSLLRTDGRINAQDAAHRLGINVRTLRRRRRQLEESGVLLGYAARVATGAFGPELQAFIQVSFGCDHEAARRFERRMRQCCEVRAAYRMTDDLAFLLHVALADGESLSDFLLADLARQPGVRSIRTRLLQSQVK